MECSYSIVDIDIYQLKLPIGLCADKQLAEPYRCIQCKNIPISPKSIEQLEVIICEGCISFFRSETTSTGEALSFKEPIKIIKQTLYNLTLNCPNRGCTKAITYQNLPDHLKLCEYTPIRMAICSSCQERVMLTGGGHEIEEHLKICTFRSEKCKYCNGEYLRNDLDGHMMLCGARKEICEYCSLEFLFKDLAQHRQSVCIQTLYIKYRDETQTLRRDLDTALSKKIYNVGLCDELQLKQLDQDKINSEILAEINAIKSILT
jgi:hypothetical protein